MCKVTSVTVAMNESYGFYLTTHTTFVVHDGYVLFTWSPAVLSAPDLFRVRDTDVPEFARASNHAPVLLKSVYRAGQRSSYAIPIRTALLT
jgi:hypothetical protein